MSRQRINIEFNHMTNTWLAKTAKRLGITRTELCRQIVVNATFYGIDDQAIIDATTEHRELSNQARAQSQIARHRHQRQ